MKYLIAPLLLAGCAAHAEEFEGFDTATRINMHLNYRVAYTYDQEYKGNARIMQPGDSGKCGDFALTKCKLLVDAGIDPDRLSFLYYYIDPELFKGAKDHLVCVIDGKWALNWQKYPTPISVTWLKALDRGLIYNATPSAWPYPVKIKVDVKNIGE